MLNVGVTPPSSSSDWSTRSILGLNMISPSVGSVFTDSRIVYLPYARVQQKRRDPTKISFRLIVLVFP